MATSVVRRRDIVRGVILGRYKRHQPSRVTHLQRCFFRVFGNNLIGDVEHSNYDVVFPDDIQGGCDDTVGSWL
jgi:hypothetical protein